MNAVFSDIKFKILIISISMLFLSSCSTSIRFASEKGGIATTSKTGEILPFGYKFYGQASYYADKFEGRQTASGEIFYQSKRTAAHKTLKFGTVLKVTNLSNNKTTIVVVNDRGPFVEDRVIDLSRSAAEEIGMIKSGIVDVEIEVLE